MTRAARPLRVFYWEEPVWRDAAAGARAVLEQVSVGENITVCRPILTYGMDPVREQRTLLRDFETTARIGDCIRWFYTPMSLEFADVLEASITVYDCMDELSAFLGAPPELLEREQELLDQADVVFTGGLSLYEAKKSRHANVHAFPSSIEVEHFAAARRGSVVEPADQAGLAHPRAGFYGVIDERFDTQLLAAVARLRPEIQFVVLGPVVKIDPATLPQAANVHYPGGKSYAELPRYLAGWDVAMMPFALNASTRYISPTKTPEYLAAGKPVVSTPIHDVVRDYGDAGLVAIAADAESFAAALDAALLPAAAAWRAKIDAKLARTSWDSTWAAMWMEIESAMPRHELRLETVSQHAVQTAPVSGPLQVRATPMGAKVLHTDHVDYIIAGAGLAGGVMAERLASELGARVLLVDRRPHIGGNTYDHTDAAGILIHKYGPHIFHTNSEDVFRYLSKFTEWRNYEHRVLASVDGKLLPIPINLDTVNGLYGLDLDAAGMEAFLAARRVTPREIRTSEDIVVSRIGRDLYQKFFRNYTRKQWGLDPSELDSAVAGRIPVRYNRDNRYFTDSFQAMPSRGYTQMFERLLDHPNIQVRLGAEFADVVRSYPNAQIVFTGPIDEYFGFRYGKLPYRSLRFEHQTHDVEWFQRAPVVNYPNDHAYTRVTEFKYLTGQQNRRTSVVYEYPCAEGDPYYPIPRPETAALYQRYAELARRTPDVHFCGRLANYRYYNMDQVVAQALKTFAGIAEAYDLAEETVA